MILFYMFLNSISILYCTRTGRIRTYDLQVMSLARCPLRYSANIRSRPGLNRRPFRCKRNVITTRPRDHLKRSNIILLKYIYLARVIRTPDQRNTFNLYSPSLYHLSYHEKGPSGDSNPGPLAPKARIIPLDHKAFYILKHIMLLAGFEPATSGS